jgi:DNA-binding transcriptional ArsR family regulator
VSDGDRPLDELFGALADPSRRRIIELLVHEGPQSATQLAEQFAFSRQAVVKHLQALSTAGLVAGERQGREVRYRATTEHLRAAVTWLLDASESWDRRADRLRSARR